MLADDQCGEVGASMEGLLDESFFSDETYDDDGTADVSAKEAGQSQQEVRVEAEAGTHCRTEENCDGGAQGKSNTSISAQQQGSSQELEREVARQKLVMEDLYRQISEKELVIKELQQKQRMLIVNNH